MIFAIVWLFLCPLPLYLIAQLGAVLSYSDLFITNMRLVLHSTRAICSSTSFPRNHYVSIPWTTRPQLVGRTITRGQRNVNANRLLPAAIAELTGDADIAAIQRLFDAHSTPSQTESDGSVAAASKPPQPQLPPTAHLQGRISLRPLRSVFKTSRGHPYRAPAVDT